MQTVRILNKTRDGILGARVLIADRWWHRLRGLLGRRRPAEGDGILLVPCRAVHTIGLGYPLDVLFLDREGEVVATYPGLRPRRFTRFHGTAEYALEVPAGTIEATGTGVGDRLVWTIRDEDLRVAAGTGDEAREGEAR